MRKLTSLFVSILLLLSLALSVQASEDALTMTDMPAKAGETVYLSVSLNQSLTADAMGIRYSYDSALLEPLPDSSLWDISGSLSDFSREDTGVWASAQPRDVKGRLFTLAFRLKDGVTLTETTVSCTVIFKNGDSDSTELTATGRIYTVCEHSYGSWANAGLLDHNRKCTLCGKNQSQRHTWNTGTTTDHPTNPGLDILTQTCTLCGATRSLEVTGEAAAPTLPTVPTVPTEPPLPTEPPPTLPPLETIPPLTEPATEPTSPQPSYGAPDSSQNQTGGQNPGSTATQPTRPIQPTGPALPTQPTQPTQSVQPTQPAPGHQTTDFNNSGSQNQTGSTGQSSTAKPTEPSKPTAPTEPVSENAASETQQPTAGTVESATEASSHNHSSHQGGYQPPVAVPIPSTEAPSAQPHDHVHPPVTQPVSGDVPGSTDHAGTASASVLLAVAVCLAGAAGLTAVLIRRNRSNKNRKSK